MPKINTDVKNSLTPKEKELFSILRNVAEQKAPGTTPRVAGGWVRDRMLGVESDDYDVMVDNMSGEDFAKLVTSSLGVADAHVIKENTEAGKNVETAKAYIPLPSAFSYPASGIIAAAALLPPSLILVL